MNERRRLADEERLDWLQLMRCENVGPVTFRRLLAGYGSAQRALAALPELARRGGRSAVRLFPRSAAAQELDAARALGADYVAAGEAGYPSLLQHVRDAPPLLCVAGNHALAARDTVAVVGARNASLAGRKMTRMLAEAFAKAGFAVASGLARGIDTAAHEAAGAANTIAVIAGGIDHFYPPENAALQQRIAAEGLLITEMAPGMAPKAEHFPRRNRIISGISRGVVVVEAALRSGSLTTARFAADQGRDVYAVPGSPLDPRAGGTNRLIRDGAMLVTAAADVLDALAAPQRTAMGSFHEEEDTLPLDTNSEATVQERARVLELLSPTPVAVDDLIRESGLGAEAVLGLLLELEVAGRVNRSSGGLVALLS